MITKFEQYNESINEKLSTLQKEYREYFKFILDCYDVKSPAKLSEEKKKEFFDNVNKYWTKGKGATKDLDKIKEDICGKDEKKNKKIKESVLEPEGEETRFQFTPDLEQKILGMGYVKRPVQENMFYFYIPDGSFDRFYVENGSTIHGSNIKTRDFLVKNARQV